MVEKTKTYMDNLLGMDTKIISEAFENEWIKIISDKKEYSKYDFEIHFKVYSNLDTKLNGYFKYLFSIYSFIIPIIIVLQTTLKIDIAYIILIISLVNVIGVNLISEIISVRALMNNALNYCTLFKKALDTLEYGQNMPIIFKNLKNDSVALVLDLFLIYRVMANAFFLGHFKLFIVSSVYWSFYRYGYV